MTRTLTSREAAVNPQEHFWNNENGTPGHSDMWRQILIIVVCILITMTIFSYKVTNSRIQSVLNTTLDTKVETMAKVEIILRRIDQEVSALAVERRQDVGRLVEIPSENQNLAKVIARKLGIPESELEAALNNHPEPGK